MKMDVSMEAHRLCIWAILLIMLAPISSGYAQESQERIEKRLPVELRTRPDVAVLLDRLRSLRRNEEKFGPKHPSRGVVLSQIAEIEEKLTAILTTESNDPGGADRKSMGTNPMEAGDVTSDWGFSPDSSWPKTLSELIGRQQKVSPFQEAYPLLQHRGIHAAGPFPGMGLVWGIEYDAIKDFSYVWMWFDHQGVTRRNLYYASAGRLESLYFPSDFDQTGEIWILRCKSIRKPTFEILAFVAEKNPPFQIDSEDARTLYEFDWGPSKASGAFAGILSTRQNGWYFPGRVRPTESLGQVGIRSIQIHEEMWVLERSDWESSKSQQLEYLEARNPEEVLKDVRTYRNITGFAEDSARDLLLIDESGRLYRMRSNRDDLRGKSDSFPGQINQLGWFDLESLASPIAPFRRRSVASGGFDSEGCLGAVESMSNQDLSFESFICMPKDSLSKENQGEDSSIPDGTILLANIWVGDDLAVSGASRKRIEETRIMLYADGEWYPSYYLWDQGNTRAILQAVDKSTSSFGIESKNSDGPAEWRVKSAAGCVECHKRQDTSFGRNQKENRLLFGVQVDTQRLEHNPLDWMGAGHPNLLKANVDWDWFKESLIESTVEPWYRNSVRPDGSFDTEMDVQWRTVSESKRTLTTQARMIHCMAAGAYASKDNGFLTASRDGFSFVLKNFKDPTSRRYKLGIGAEGNTEDVASVALANAQLILALSLLSEASNDKRYVNQAIDCWLGWRDYALGDSADLTLVRVEFLSALLELYDRCRDRGLRSDIDSLLDLLARTTRESTGFVTGVPIGAQQVGDGRVELGLGVQADWAYGVSRAIELGFSARYMALGLRAIQSILEESDAIQNLEKAQGSNERIAWTRARLLRVAMRYWYMHDRLEFGDFVSRLLEQTIEKHMNRMDGGWIEPDDSIRHVPFHEVRMYLEAIRIASKLK